MSNGLQYDHGTDLEQIPAVRPRHILRTAILWQHRQLLARVTVFASVISLAIAFAIPKKYTSSASIMPPDQQSSGAMMLAALASRAGALGGLSGLAGGLLGGHTSSALFMDLLRSGTVSGHLMDRFELQHVYRKRYRIDTAKYLARCTTITDDKKSGVITIAVEDTDPVRARDLTAAYLSELNSLVTQTSTSSAHQERLFIERRLQFVEKDLEHAQLELSEFSSRNSTIDIKEQTRAMVDAGAKVEGELLVEQSGLESLRQLYGEGNLRVRQVEARIASLQHDLKKMTGRSDPLSTSTDGKQDSSDVAESKSEFYPPLRQLPRLAVPYANLYRRVRVQETVYELLTQQYEMAHIEEAKDVPVISVIDSPSLPEKKSFPPRLLVALLLTIVSLAFTAAFVVLRDTWSRVDAADPRKALLAEMLPVLQRRFQLKFSRRTNP